jgi:ADP-ribosylglycohydrolase
MNTFPHDHQERLARARLSLDGLSTGDAFGECFFADPEVVTRRVFAREVPRSPWRYTDDTAMGLSIYACLATRGRIDRDHLAELFAQEYERDPWRGYGGTAHSILRAIGNGVPWEAASGEAFSGMGSMGNGGAMRVGPLGAYFADDPERLIREARMSAEVTHAHPEGQAGAIAGALAAAWAWTHASQKGQVDPREMIASVLAAMPEGDTHTRLRRALDVPLTREPEIAAAMLGNGSKITAPDTVPFALWCAARHCWDYAEALWTTVRGHGDVDTNCAIVGGIVSLSAGAESIPEAWLRARGNLPIADL